MLITFICLGKFLEASAKGRTSEAITALMNLTPTQAVLVHSDPTTGMQWEQNIEAKLAQRGDTLKVYPGSKIPTDGVVQQVSSYPQPHMWSCGVCESRRSTVREVRNASPAECGGAHAAVRSERRRTGKKRR
jgi:hypothetical protein